MGRAGGEHRTVNVVGVLPQDLTRTGVQRHEFSWRMLFRLRLLHAIEHGLGTIDQNTFPAAMAMALCRSESCAG